MKLFVDAIREAAIPFDVDNAQNSPLRFLKPIIVKLQCAAILGHVAYRFLGRGLRATGTDAGLSPVCTEFAYPHPRPCGDMVGDDTEIGVRAKPKSGRNPLSLREVTTECENMAGDDKRAGDRIRTGDVQLGQ